MEPQAVTDRVCQAIIPAAGWGTRLFPLSYAVPKELLPIDRKPALQWIAEELAAAGMNHLILVANPSKLPLDRLFRDDPRLVAHLRDKQQSALLQSLWAYGPYAQVRVDLVYQMEQLGLGHAIACGRDQLKPGPFVVALGDSLISPPGRSSLMRRLLNAFHDRKATAAIALETVPADQVTKYGIADPVGDGEVFALRDLVEKPRVEDSPSQLAVAARYVFDQEVFKAIEATPRGAGGEYQLTDAIRRLIRQGRRVVGVRLESGEQRFDIGSYDGYQRAVASFREHAATWEGEGGKS